MIGIQQVACVTALLISFVALIALVNGLTQFLGSLVGFDQLSMQMILGYLLSPFAFLMGVPMDESIQAASFIGQKIVVNEFVAYVDFMKVAENLSEKTQSSFSLSVVLPTSAHSPW